MKGSILIVLLFIMMAAAFVTITAFPAVYNQFVVSNTEDTYQMTYYLAESALNTAFDDLSGIIRDTHEQVLMSYKWDPLRTPQLSLQEGARKHMRDNFGLILKNKLTSEKYLSTSYAREPVIEGLPEGASMDVQILWISYYTDNPLIIHITSKAKIGKIKRRIDMGLNINKVSTVYDSKLFENAVICGGNINVSESGVLVSNGNVYAKGGISVFDNSNLCINGDTFIWQDILVSESTAGFWGRAFCGSLAVTGSKPGNIVCGGDLYSYGRVEASGAGNTAYIKGSLYICPEYDDLPYGVNAENGGQVITDGEVFIKDNPLYPDSFFQEILLHMKQQAGWDYKYQLNESIAVSNTNAILDGGSLSVAENDSPFVYIAPETNNIELTSGDYSGILFTNGSISVREGENVTFRGIMIAGGCIDVKGNLSVETDKDLLIALLEQAGEPLMNFFRISAEEPLIEVISCRERFYDEQIVYR